MLCQWVPFLGDLPWGGGTERAPSGKHQPPTTSPRGRGSDHGNLSGCFADLTGGLAASQGGFISPFITWKMNLLQLKDECAPQEGDFVIAYSLHLISGVVYRGARHGANSSSKPACPPAGSSWGLDQRWKSIRDESCDRGQGGSQGGDTSRVSPVVSEMTCTHSVSLRAHSRVDVPAAPWDPRVIWST